MKKLILIFLTLFLINIDIKALTKFTLGEKVPNMYIEEYTDTNLHNGAPFILRKDDGSVVYCINPFETINTTDYYKEFNYNDSYFNLTDEQINRINLISYFGYNYENHTELKWYGVTQFLIWKTMNFNDIYFTDKYYGSRISAYESEINEIETLINNYNLLPSFNNNSYEFTSNKSYEIIDSNNVLDNYKIYYTNIDSYIKDNILYINTKEDGIYNIKFIKTSPISDSYLLYKLENAQSLIYPGKINELKFEINIEVNSGIIKINKKDSENINRIDASLEGAIYGLYENDILVTTIETDKEGIGYLYDVPLGKYYLKELKPSNGYNIDTNLYYINLNKNNKEVIIKSYEDVIKGNLIINKFYGSNDLYEIENGAIFDLYNSNNEFIDSFETVNGSFETELPFGEYSLIQKKGINGYKFVNKLDLFIKENIDYKIDLYNEKEVTIVSVGDTHKNNYSKFISYCLIIIGLSIILLNRFIYNKKTT